MRNIKMQETHRESENEGENLVQKKSRTFEIARIEIISIRGSTENVNEIEMQSADDETKRIKIEGAVNGRCATHEGSRG